MRKALRTFCTAAAMILALTAVDITAFAESEETDTAPSEYVTDSMRAVILSPGVDYGNMNGDEIETASQQLDIITENMNSIGLDTMIIRTVNDNCGFYDSELNSDGGDYTSLALQKARDNGLNVMLMYDVNYALANADDFSDYISDTHRFALKYECDGIVLDDYYVTRGDESYGDYMKQGSGIGYEQWLYDIAARNFRTASEVLRMTNSALRVGIMLSDMWANVGDNELGSDTLDTTSALYDGFSDTKAYIEDGYADFAMVRAYGSMTDPALPFEAVTKWWSDICETSNTTLYVVHNNDKLGTSAVGWYSEDQLLRQLTTAKELGSYKGSAFCSYSSLVTNKAATELIKQYFAEQIDEESLFEDLMLTSPKKFNFTTYEPVVDFMGTFDSNFDVKLNGKKIELNDAGNFYFEKNLDIGMNKFVIEHKGQIYTYKIERKITVLKSIDSSIAEGKALNVDGGTKITVSAIAYKGAKVTATLNGTTIKLKERSSALEDSDSNTSYASYSAKITVPEGIIGSAQALGQIKVTSSYEGYTMSMLGATVKVNAEPEPPKEVVVIETEMKDEQSVGTGEIVGTIDPVKTSGAAAKFVKLYNDYTFVYDAKTTGSVLTPNFGQLPAGTIDYYKSSSGSFYITESGKRFNSADATVIDSTAIGENKLVVKAVGTTGGDSYIKLGLDYRTSYNVEVIGNSYYSGIDGDYELSSFTADYVYITFDNVTSVTKLPSFENNNVFSSGKWETVKVDGIPKFRLILALRQKGVYAGNGASYNSDGDLMLTFPVLTNVLSNMNIVIDPGHGYDKTSDTLDPGAIGHVVEQEVNLGVAKALQSALSDLGVNAVRLQTEKELLVSATRPIIARQYGCDLYISLHSNKAVGNEYARGVEVYYFTSYSQPLASAVSASIASYFSKSVYSDGADKNRGAKYSYYWVTEQQDFPSILIEMGFVSNLEDAMALADSTHQKGIAAAIISGIKSYISRSSISYTVNAGSSVELPEDEEPASTEPEITEPPIDTTEIATETTPEIIESLETSATTEPPTEELESEASATDEPDDELE